MADRETWMGDLTKVFDGVTLGNPGAFCLGVSLSDRRGQECVIEIDSGVASIVAVAPEAPLVSIELPSESVEQIAVDPQLLIVGFMRGAVKMTGESGHVVELLRCVSCKARAS